MIGTKTIVRIVDNKIAPRNNQWKQMRRDLVINNEVQKFSKTFKDSFATLIITSLGLVAALSWNDAIKTAIETMFPKTGAVFYKFYIAILVTIISIFLTYFITKLKPKY
jgi:hypothetical protein